MKPTVKHGTLIALAVGTTYIAAFNHTPHGTECHRSKSPDGMYVAERCLLDWVPGGNSRYVGRLFEVSTGKLLAQHSFDTPVPTILWGDYEGRMVLFSVGDGGDDASSISIPPSRWDRLLAARLRP